jgi:hypothetical protein
MLLFIPSEPEEFFALREYIILFISASVVGIVLIPGNFLGNAFFRDK